MGPHSRISILGGHSRGWAVVTREVRIVSYRTDPWADYGDAAFRRPIATPQ
jgi:hypothetical protein